MKEIPMSSTPDPIVIVAAKRTAMGAFQGQFKSLTSPQLAAAAIAAAVEQSAVNGEDFSEAIPRLRATGRRRPSAGAPSRARSRLTPVIALHHHQQGLRLPHEAGDARSRP